MEETKRLTQSANGKNTMPDDNWQKSQAESTNFAWKILTFVQDLFSPVTVEPDASEIFISKNSHATSIHNENSLPKAQHSGKSAHYSVSCSPKHPPSSQNSQPSLTKSAGTINNNSKHETQNAKTFQQNIHPAVSNNHELIAKNIPKTPTNQQLTHPIPPSQNKAMTTTNSFNNPKNQAHNFKNSIPLHSRSHSEKTNLLKLNSKSPHNERPKSTITKVKTILPHTKESLPVTQKEKKQIEIIPGLNNILLNAQKYPNTDNFDNIYTEAILNSPKNSFYEYNSRPDESSYPNKESRMDCLSPARANESSLITGKENLCSSFNNPTENINERQLLKNIMMPPDLKPPTISLPAQEIIYPKPVNEQINPIPRISSPEQSKDTYNIAKPLLNPAHKIDIQDERMKIRFEEFRQRNAAHHISVLSITRNTSKEKINNYRKSKMLVCENIFNIEMLIRLPNQAPFKKMDVDIPPAKQMRKSEFVNLPDFNIIIHPLFHTKNSINSSKNKHYAFPQMNNDDSKKENSNKLSNDNNYDFSYNPKQFYSDKNKKQPNILNLILNESNIDRLIRLLYKYNHAPTFEIMPLKRGLNDVKLTCRNAKLYRKFKSIIRNWTNYIIKQHYLENIQISPQKQKEFNNDLLEDLKHPEIENKIDKNSGIFMAKTINLHDWKIYYCKPDGNCMFRAFAFILTGNQENHLIMRKLAVDYIIANKDYFIGFIDSDFSEYIAKLSQDKNWGDAIALQAFSKILERKIELYAKPKNSNALYLKKAFFEEISGSQDSLKLLYTPGHYDAIIKRDFRIRASNYKNVREYGEALNAQAGPNYCL